MKRKTNQIVSSEVLKRYLLRFLAGDSFEVLLASWRVETGYAGDTLKDVLRGAYATDQAALAYRELGYERRSIHFAPRNFRARLLVPQLLDIRRRMREGQARKDVARLYEVGEATIDLIVTGRYASLAMPDALKAEAEAQQCRAGAIAGP